MAQNPARLERKTIGKASNLRAESGWKILRQDQGLVMRSGVYEIHGTFVVHFQENQTHRCNDVSWPTVYSQSVALGAPIV